MSSACLESISVFLFISVVILANNSNPSSAKSVFLDISGKFSSIVLYFVKSPIFLAKTQVILLNPSKLLSTLSPVF